MNDRHSPSRFRFRLNKVSVVAVFGFFVLALFGIGPSPLPPYSSPIAEASHCLERAQCNEVTPHLCQGECKSTLTCASDGTLKQIPGSCGFQVSPLSISDINLANITSSTATITWTTNKVADAKVNYGLSSSYGTTVVGGSPDSRSHSVTLIGLEASTTYHYQVVSSTGTETARSTDRTFQTSSGSGGPGGSGPTITFGPRVDATNDRATVVFNTSPDTAAMVEYTTDPGSAVLSAQACDSGFSCPPPQPPSQVSGAHSILLTGLTQANSEYRYKITIVDSVGSVSITSEFTFKTSASSTDHVFSTGGCIDGTLIGQCNIAGQYCRPGGGAPVYDCRPDIPCPKQCGAKFTCQATGDCTPDLPLTGSPTQCNQEKCYKKCNNQSGRLTGKACTIDNDCVDTGDDSRGRCVIGSFTNPAVPGCVASWPSCDANVILKVRPDRVCDKWLTCKTSVPVKDESGKTENQCFDLTICNSLSLAGQCNKLLEGRQCDNDPLRFCASDSDCLADGKCLPGGTNKAITYNTPSQVSRIQNLSGYAKAGLEWNTISRPEGPPRIEGFYPLSVAQQVGTKVDVPNGDFEQTRTVGKCSQGPPKSCSSASGCNQTTEGTCQFSEDENFYVDQYWDALPSGTADVQIDREGSATSLNRMLKITPTKDPGTGATTTLDMGITTQSNAEYLLTVRMKSSQQGGGSCSGKAADANDDGKTCTQDGQCSSALCGGQHIKVSLENDAAVVKDFATVVLTTSWRTFHLGPITGPSGVTNITFTTTTATDPVDFWIDDLTMLPALKVNATDEGLLEQNCRLYPKDNATACDFTDKNDITYRGLKGYCLERDPLNTAVCLSWWPVDILSGENIFGQDSEAGYAGRRPLYYCAEAYGQNNHPDEHLLNHLDAYKFNDGGKFTDSDGHGTCDLGAARNQICGSLYGTFRVMSTVIYSGVDSGDVCDVIENRAACRDRRQRGFCYCQEAKEFKSDLITPTDEDRTIRLNEVDSFRVVPQRTTKEYKDMPILELGRANNWSASFGRDASNCMGAAFSLQWNEDGTLKGYAWTVDESCATDFKKGIFAIGMFRMKERCTKLVQVATDTQDVAWVDRTSASSSYAVPDLNYRYVTDLAPVGGAAAPSNTEEPSQWQPGALLVEGPNKNLSLPYQTRGGAAYACEGECSGKVCGFDSGEKAGQTCLDSSECVDPSNPVPIEGSCSGNGICLAYNVKTREFSGSKQACTKNDDCSTTPGEECIGGAASKRGSQTSSSINPALSDPVFAQYHLMRLFAKAYGYWKWNPANDKYDTQPLFDSWQPPTRLCKVCSGGTSGSRACLSTTNCGADSTCIDTPRHPTENAGSQTTADYCAIKPSLTNVVDAGKSGGLGEGSSYILKFNSNVDREQRPLKRITIDWGDCVTNPNCTTNDTVSIAPRDDPNNPHAYTHVYHCGKTDGSACTYQVLLQIEDNWGWCDNGVNEAPCNSSKNTWINGPSVTVSP